MQQFDPQDIQRQVVLAPMTTFQIGGPAEYFYAAKSAQALQAAVAWAAAERMPIFVLGGGSNLLIADEGIPGLVIADQITDFSIEETRIVSGSGVKLSHFVDQAAQAGLAGAQYLVGIPGNVGGAVRGNAGAWGHNIGELITRVTIFDGQQIRQLHQSQCCFTYRHSLIKDQGWQVVQMECQLQRGDTASLEQEMASFLKQRSLRHTGQPSAGSVFKNIPLAEIADPDGLIAALDCDRQAYMAATQHGKLPVGFINAALGFRGMRIGGAAVSDKHGNIIVNTGGATAADVLELISVIKQKVHQVTGLQLVEEVMLLGH